MGKFDGILLCTDLDGTLLRSDKTISPENLRAMEYFKSEGGLFTVVTGRLPFYAGNIFEIARPNAPVGCGNGSAIYDLQRQTYLWTYPLADSAKAVAEWVAAEFPQIGILVNTFHMSYFYKTNHLTSWLRGLRSHAEDTDTLSCITEPMSGITFYDEAEVIIRLQNLLEGHPMTKEFSLLHSEKLLFELLPTGTGKHLAVEKLAELLQLDPQKTIAVGDYYNDLTMLQRAGTGIAVANAAPEVKAAADYVTVSNEEHAIAQIIADLEQGGIETFHSGRK